MPVIIKFFFATILLISSFYLISEKLSTDLIKIFSLDFYLYVFLILLLSQFILSFRWYSLSKLANKKISFYQSLIFGYTFTSFAGLTFSGGSEIFRYLNIKSSKLNISQMSIIIVFEKLFSVFSILFIIFIGLLIIYQIKYWLYIALFFFIIVFILLKILFNLSNLPYLNLMNYEYSEFKYTLINNKKSLLFIISISIFSQLLSVFLYSLFFSQFTDVSLIKLFLLIPISNFIISLSFFTFNGIGVREFLFMGFSALMIIPIEQLFLIGINSSFIITVYMLLSFVISNFFIKIKNHSKIKP